MKRLMVILGAVLLSGALFVLAPSSARAADPFSKTINNNVCANGNTIAGCSSGTSIGGANGYLSTLIDGIIYIGAIIAVIFLLIGSIRYITSTGDAKRIQSAKDTIMYAVIGLIVMILARGITAFVIHGVNKIG